jgi:hypothetical protein
MAKSRAKKPGPKLAQNQINIKVHRKRLWRFLSAAEGMCISIMRKDRWKLTVSDFAGATPSWMIKPVWMPQ